MLRLLWMAIKDGQKKIEDKALQKEPIKADKQPAVAEPQKPAARANLEAVY